MNNIPRESFLNRSAVGATEYLVLNYVEVDLVLLYQAVSRSIAT